MKTASLANIVERDLLGKPITEEEKQRLHGNPEAWRAELVLRLQDIDRQLTQRRAESMAAQDKNVRIQYETWKRSAVGYKLVIIGRIQEVKSIVKARNFDAQLEYNIPTLLNAILDELRAIRARVAQKEEK